MIKGLETRTLPPQADFSVPNPRLAAAAIADAEGKRQ
jgi:hypothetical protein